MGTWARCAFPLLVNLIPHYPQSALMDSIAPPVVRAIWPDRGHHYGMVPLHFGVVFVVNMGSA
jgi:hypothetical protein